MANKPLNQLEGEVAAALVASFWAMLKGDKGAPTVEQAMEEMKGVELDCGDGRKIEIDTPQGRKNVGRLIDTLTEDAQRIVQYLFDHPTRHSRVQLERLLGISGFFVSVSLYRLTKLGFVNKSTGYSVELDEDGYPGGSTAVNMYQINVAAWLKEAQRRKAADDRIPSMGAGIKPELDPEVREMILHELYRCGQPVAAMERLVREMILHELYRCGQPVAAMELFDWPAVPRDAHGGSGGLLRRNVDALEHMVENGDVVKSRRRGVGMWQNVVYFLSAREFVRMADADNCAKRKQAGRAHGGCIRRLLRRLLGR